jgi:hypothetical protein
MYNPAMPVLTGSGVQELPADPGMYIHMRFESGEPGTTAFHASGTQNSEAVFTSATAANFTYDDAESFTYEQSLKLDLEDDSMGNSWGGLFFFEELSDWGGRNLVKHDEFWCRLRIKFPVGWLWNAGRNKFFRFRTLHDDPASISEGYNDLYIDSHHQNGGNFAYISEGGAGFFFGMGPATVPFTLGQWHTIEFYLKLDNINGPDGGLSMMRMWKDGILLGETDAHENLAQGDSYVRQFNLFTFFGNEPSTQAQACHCDDLILRTSRPAAQDAGGNYFIGL